MGRAVLGFNPLPTIVGNRETRAAREGRRDPQGTRRACQRRMDGKGDGAKPTITVTTLIQ